MDKIDRSSIFLLQDNQALREALQLPSEPISLEEESEQRLEENLSNIVDEIIFSSTTQYSTETPTTINFPDPDFGEHITGIEPDINIPTTNNQTLPVTVSHPEVYMAEIRKREYRVGLNINGSF